MQLIYMCILAGKTWHLRAGSNIVLHQCCSSGHCFPDLLVMDELLK